MNKRLFWINVCKSRGFKTNGELLSTKVLSLTSTSSQYFQNYYQKLCSRQRYIHILFCLHLSLSCLITIVLVNRCFNR